MIDVLKVSDMHQRAEVQWYVNLPTDNQTDAIILMIILIILTAHWITIVAVTQG